MQTIHSVKYYFFSTYSSRTLTHLPHLGKSSNIPLQSGSFSLSSSWTLLCTVPMNKASSADKSQSVIHYFNKISPSTRATLKSALDVVGRPVRSSSLISDHIRARCTISDMKHYHYANITHVYQLRGEFQQVIHVSPTQIESLYELLRRTTFLMLLPRHINLFMDSIQLTLAPTVACYRHYKCQPLPENAVLA